MSIGSVFPEARVHNVKERGNAGLRLRVKDFNVLTESGVKIVMDKIY